MSSSEESTLAITFHKNSCNFISFAHEVANDFADKYKLNMKIYPWLSLAAKMTTPEKTIENFIRVSMKPAAKDRHLYKQPTDLPVVQGKSRFPYWENIRIENIDFFTENVVLLLPELDMKKISEWQALIPDLQYFTNEIITAEISKLLALFKTRVISEEDIRVLWEYFNSFIESTMKYIYHRRKRESGYLEGINIERELKLFKIKEY